VPAAWLRRTLFVCFFLSGITGLVFEVVWGRYLATYVGGSTVAHTIVLGTFMGGLALGNALFGRLVDRVENRLVLYAWLELGIGGLCLTFPEWFSLLGNLYVSFGASPTTPGLLALKALLAVIAMLPACILIGGTLPALAKAVVGQLQEVGVRVGQMYFINTFGALVGVALGGFVLIERFGAEASIRGTALLNIAIGLLFYALSRRRADAVEPVAESTAARTYTEREIAVVLAAIGFSGFLSMTLEVVWIRLLALVLGSSTYSFSIMLLSFIGGICLGSVIVAWLMRADRDALPLLVLTQAGIALGLLALMPFYERLPYWFNVLSTTVEHNDAGFAAFLVRKVGLCLALMLIPTTFIGMTLPLASRVATRRVGVLGKSVGSVFSINTLGTLLGAAIGGLVLMPALGLEGTFRTVIVLNAVLAVVLWGAVGRVRPPAHWAAAATSLILAVVIVAASPAWNKTVLLSGVFRYGARLVADDYAGFEDIFNRRQVLSYEDGLDATVAVVEMSNGDRALLINGKADATAIEDLMTQRMLGHVGMLLNPPASDVLVIGLGSGATASSVRRHPDTTVDVVEISAGVARAAREQFADVNDDVLEDEQVNLFLGDAKDFLKLQPGRTWDVIVSEPSNPWIAGIGGLFTSDYWSEVKEHLADDGLLVQWVQVYEMDDRLLSVIFNTFGSVFEHASVWEIDDFDLVLIGSNAPLRPDFAGIARRLRHPLVRRELTESSREFSVVGVEDLLAMQVIGEAAFSAWFPGRGPLNTDDRPLVEYMAPRALFRRDTASIPGDLDSRRRHPHRDLVLDRLIAEHGPLSPVARLRLARLLSSRGSGFDAPNMMSLVWDAYSQKSSDTRTLFERAGLRLPADETPSGPVCEATLEIVLQYSGIFYDPAPLGDVLVGCIDKLRGHKDLPDALVRAGRFAQARVLVADCTTAACVGIRARAGDRAALVNGRKTFPDDPLLKYLEAVIK